MDLKNIYEYIAADSSYYAKIHINRIRTKARALKQQPRLGRVVPEMGIENIRELIFGSYRIIYRIVNPERIDIITIYHSARILKII
jgi:plasmid stabilization system protein ParE